MFDLNQYPYPSKRKTLLAKNYVVASSQHLASIAGLEMFLSGGNAVDAAIATAITLTVVEPTSNGIGGDAQAIVLEGDKLHGFNGSGKSPLHLSPDSYAGMTAVPEIGWLSVTVPGAVALWRTLWEKWGKLPFERLFEPAIRHAVNGFPLTPVTATAWERAETRFLPLKGREYEPFKRVFFPKGRSPRTGEIWGSGDHARTLRSIAVSGGESFYRGELADKILNFSDDTGGCLVREDFSRHRTLEVNPISSRYRDSTVWELPPNTQGIAALMALNILEGFDIGNIDRDSPDSWHWQIEAMKSAFADVYYHVGDPDFMEVGIDRLLDKTYARERRESIGDRASLNCQPGIGRGGTVYLAAADRELMVSFIQSNYEGFGSGLLIPETGIALHDRAAGFSLEPDHPNRVAPDKRPFHTIIPAFIELRDGTIGPFGVMGAPMQPQGHLQTVVKLVDYHFNPQAALDAPRWRFLSGNNVLLEAGTPPEIITGLGDRGHDITITKWRGAIAPDNQFGKGQIILKNRDLFIAGSEPRADGLALGI